jgi:DNA invertase Pin-like site-specific DNA recombinase
VGERAVPHLRRFLGQRLRVIRKHRGLSQERLGARAGLSGKFLGEVERGKKSISIDSLSESGILEDRRALRRLLRDCRAGRVGAVIIPTLDRLSRDVRLAENLFHEFDGLGVRVLIADMPNYNGKDRRDVLLRQIREAIAEENRKDIIERLWKGRQERVRRGRPAGGNLAYGYRREGKSVVIEPAEAELVRRIYDLAATGLRASALARALNGEGRVRRNGKPWTQRQVASILARRPLYEEGRLRYGEVSGQDKTLVLPHEGTS